MPETRPRLAVSHPVRVPIWDPSRARQRLLDRVATPSLNYLIADRRAGIPLTVKVVRRYLGDQVFKTIPGAPGTDVSCWLCNETPVFGFKLDFAIFSQQELA